MLRSLSTISQVLGSVDVNFMLVHCIATLYTTNSGHLNFELKQQINLVLSFSVSLTQNYNIIHFFVIVLQSGLILNDAMSFYFCKIRYPPFPEK